MVEEGRVKYCFIIHMKMVKLSLTISLLPYATLCGILGGMPHSYPFKTSFIWVLVCFWNLKLINLYYEFIKVYDKMLNHKIMRFTTFYV